MKRNLNPQRARSKPHAGPGSASASATCGSRPEIKSVGSGLGKPGKQPGKRSEMMESRHERTGIVPGDIGDRLTGWYGKKPNPSGGLFAGLRRFFG